jgi:hypothetical protein
VPFRHRFAHRDSSAILQLQIARPQPSDVTLAAQVRAREANAFLLRKPEHLDGKRQPHSAPLQFLQRRERHQHAERAIETPRLPDRVEVRAEQQRAGQGVGAFPPADQVAHGVLAHGQAGRRHPAGDLRVRPPHRW